MDLWVRNALRPIFDVRGDQKTIVGISSEEKSLQNEAEIENENLYLECGHLDVPQKRVRQARSDHFLYFDVKTLQINHEHDAQTEADTITLSNATHSWQRRMITLKGNPLFRRFFTARGILRCRMTTGFSARIKT